MRLLLDTNIALWRFDDPSYLENAAAAAISDPENGLVLATRDPLVSQYRVPTLWS